MQSCPLQLCWIQVSSICGRVGGQVRLQAHIGELHCLSRELSTAKLRMRLAGTGGARRAHPRVHHPALRLHSVRRHLLVWLWRAVGEPCHGCGDAR